MPANVTERHFLAFTSSDVGAAAVAGDAWVTLDFGVLMSAVPSALKRKKFLLYAVETLRASGASATAHTALVADVTGSASTAWATKYQSAAVAAGTRLNETGIDKPLYTDTAGKLFFTPGGDAADTFNYAVWFEVLG